MGSYFCKLGYGDNYNYTPLDHKSSSRVQHRRTHDQNSEWKHLDRMRKRIRTMDRYPKCLARTLSGNTCQNPVYSSGNRCWQH